MKTYCIPGVSRRNDNVGMFATQCIKKGTVLMPSPSLAGRWKFLPTKSFIPSEPVYSFHSYLLMNRSHHPNVCINSLQQVITLQDIAAGDELYSPMVDHRFDNVHLAADDPARQP